MLDQTKDMVIENKKASPNTDDLINYLTIAAQWFR
jgi:hypothetical protein